MSASVTVADYEGLQTFVCGAIGRDGEEANAVNWIAIAEARLNRELGPVETDQTLTGTADSRRIDVSAYTITKPVALFLAETGYDEREVLFKADGSFPYLVTTGRPSFAAMDGSNAYIDFDRPLDAAYPFRFRYQGRFALSDSSPTNWLLTYHPDIYIAAAIVWGFGYRQEYADAGPWKAILDEGLVEVRNVIAASRKGTLTVDTALQPMVPMSYSGWANG